MLVTALLVITGALALPAAVNAQTSNPYERGPAPTRASIEAARGPYEVATTAVSSAAVGPGFGGGTVYFPTTTADGTFGAVAISPGYTGTQSSISWYGARLASQGFVVITIDSVASVRSHSIPFDESLPATNREAYLELAGAGHGAPNSPNTTIASYSISWLSASSTTTPATTSSSAGRTTRPRRPSGTIGAPVPTRPPRRHRRRPRRHPPPRPLRPRRRPPRRRPSPPA